MSLSSKLNELASAFATAVIKAATSAPLSELAELKSAAPAPAKRGRPKGSKNTGAKRGRPKGSKNKPKSEDGSTTQGESPATETAEAPAEVTEAAAQ